MIADVALVRCLEDHDARNTADYARILAGLRPESGAAVMPVAGGYAVATGAAFPINRACGLGFADPVRGEDLDAIETFYRERGLPAQIEVCPHADHSLMDGLAGRISRIQQFFTIHALDLAAWAKDAGRAAPRTDVRVTPLDDADLWTRVVCDQLEAPDDWQNDVCRTLARVAFERPGMTAFAAWIGPTIAGAGGLALREGVASLFSAGTLPGYRRRGVQTALLHARLAAAADAGCTLAMAMTIPGSSSQRNVLRAGFQAIYTKPVLLLRDDRSGAEEGEVR